MKPQSVPRVNLKIADVMQEGGVLVAKMNVWLQQCLYLLGRNPAPAVAAQAVGASPYTYTNNGDFDVTALVTGGTVSAVDFTRDGTNFFTVATASPATVTLNPGDAVRITWAVLPTLTLIPR
jgi:hypothetical protein